MMPVDISCTHCFDSGICFIEFHQGPSEMLMLCNCAQGAIEHYKLPRWEFRVGGIASRKPFPADWFRPKEKLENYFTNRIVEQWKAKVKVAEEFWEHQRSEVT